MLLFLDFESYFDTKNGYHLNTRNGGISIVEYVRSHKFKAFGAGLAVQFNTPTWFSANELTDEFNELDWNNIDLVIHNAKFDAFILKEIYGHIPRSYICTKGMSRAVLGKSIKNHSLATIAEHFGFQPKGTMKTDRLETLTPEQQEELAEYCMHDVELCQKIYLELEKNFPKSEYRYLHQTIDMFVNPKLQLNVPLLEKANEEETERRKNIFKEIGIEKKEFASNKKFPELLKSKGYDIPYKPSPRQIDSKGKSILIPALALGDPEFVEMKESDDEMLRTLCEARVAAKSTLLETRSKKLADIGKTGLWPFDVEYSGADQTHRFSGGSGAGGNPQNFTRDSVLREAVEAPEGYSLVVGDFSQIEFRIVAYLSRDPGLLELINSGKDFYCSYGSMFFGKEITKEHIKERKFAKDRMLSLQYGTGWEKTQKTTLIKTGIKLSEERAKEAVELYRTKYNQVPALWEKLHRLISNLIIKNLNLKIPNIPVTFVHEGFFLPSGLKVRFPNLRQEINERNNNEWIYDVYNKGHLEKRKLYGAKFLENISQSLTGELKKFAMGYMGEQVAGELHDELLITCKKGLELITKQKLYKAMTTSPSWLPGIVLDAEVHIGKNWKECK